MHSIANASLDALRDPHVEATKLFSYLLQPALAARMPIPSIPGTLLLESGTPRGATSLIGADTEAVLAAHGYSALEIADLHRRGIVAAATT